MYGERMEELFDRWAAVAFERQWAMLERFGPGDWTGDPARGVIRKDGVERPAQFLGRESECGRTWTWAWAYPTGAVPEASLAAARRLREFGREQEHLALLVPEFDLAGRCGHQLGMIACGVLGAEFYVECESPEGSFYFASLARAPEPTKDPIDQVFRVFPAMVAHRDCMVKDQRRALEAYLGHYGFRLERSREAGGELVCATLPGSGRMLLASFDRLNRAVSLAEARRAGRRRP